MMAIADGALYFKNRVHVYTAANRQAELTFAGPGDGNPGLPGKTDYDLFPEMYADAYYRLEKEVFAGSPGASETQALPDEDGKKRWVESRKFALKDPGGRIIGLFCVSIGITENMKASQELHALLTEILHVDMTIYKAVKTPLGRCPHRERHPLVRLWSPLNLQVAKVVDTVSYSWQFLRVRRFNTEWNFMADHHIATS